MIGPDGAGGRYGTPQGITSVTASDREVKVLFGVEGDADDRIRVVMRLGMEQDDAGLWLPEDIEVAWSGTGRRDRAYAAAFHEALGQANLCADLMHEITHERSSAWWHDPNPEIAKGIIGGRPDYLLAAYLILHGVGAFYKRGKARSPEDIANGLHDLDALRTTALRLLNEKVIPEGEPT